MISSRGRADKKPEPATITLPPSAPTVYRHATQPDWGRGVASSVRADRTTYVFEHAGERTFLHGSPAILAVTLAVEERQALARTLLSRRAPTKKKAAPKRVAPVDPSLTTFERQVEMFKATFPEGFADARFVNEKRAVTKRDAGIELAREILSAKALDDALDAGAYGSVLESAARVVAAMQSLMLPKADQRGFERIPDSACERFARTLRDLLHGETDYASRFDAFVGSASTQPWTVATLFSATVHPGVHAFIKPTLSQKQARALDLEEPPGGVPTGDAYAEHLAIAQATRERLLEAGLEPRDMLDVYSFEWRTLTRAARAAQP